VIRRALLPALSLILVGSLASPAAGDALDDDLKEIRQSILAITARMNDAAGERSTVAADMLQTQERLDAAEARVAAVAVNLARVTAEHDERTVTLEGVRAELVERFASLAEIREDRDDALGEAKASVLEAYVSGGAAQPSIAFSATAVSDVAVGVVYLDVLTGYRSGAADRYAAIVEKQEVEEAKVKTAEASLLEEVDALEETAGEMQATESELEAKRSDLAGIYERQVGLLSKVQAEIAEFEGELSGLEREEASVRSKIRAASQPTGTTPGRLVRPVPGKIESGFGPRVHPIFGTVKMHTGLDMHGASGTPISSAAAGTVIFAGVKGGYGNAVMIDHGGGMVTLYAHQSSLAVTVGQKVSAGQTIGYVGSSGLSTGPHLHFEVRINGVAVDPLKYM